MTTFNALVQHFQFDLVYDRSGKRLIDWEFVSHSSQTFKRFF
ncbi:hypothetical protein [Holospora undulata]|nr:hypothetical protein [Holospora undulata]